MTAAGHAAAAHAVVVVAIAATLSACAGASARPAPRTEAPVRSAPAPRAHRHDAEPPQVAAVRPPQPAAPAAPPAALHDDDGPLTAKIDATTPPRRAAALRLTEQARGMLERGETPHAIEILERAISVDARTPYAYYFLAEAHARAGHRALARSFASRAEQLLTAEPYWLARARALRGRIAEDEGRADEARDAYTRALVAWPRNDTAASGLARLGGARQGAP
jgi:Flp pilus assembly protein TadD